MPFLLAPIPLTKSLYACLCTTEYKGMNVMRSFVGINSLEINHVAYDVVFVGNAVTSEHIACLAGYIECLAAVIPFHHGDGFRCGRFSIAHLTQTVGPNTMKWIEAEYSGTKDILPLPMGIRKTDNFLMKLSELFDKPIPESLKAERGRAVDAMTDAHQYIHGKKFAIAGDPDYLLGIVSFLLEMGAVPYHIICSRSTKKFQKELQALLDTSPLYGKQGKIYINKDLWHLRSLCMTDPIDGIIGDTHCKWVARDAKIPHFRIGFPIMDRVNVHRTPVIGYQGTINFLTVIVNKFLDIVDETCEDQWFEMMR